MIDYDHTNRTKFSFEEVEAKIGSRAKLTLTGEIIGAGESCNGPFARFKLDERFGFGDFALVIDLDALELQQD